MTTRYEAAHQNFSGPGDARPTATQIIQDENLEGKWSDKTILITGCSSGLGVETAQVLFQTGATLYLTARDLGKAKIALGSIVDSDRVHLLELDLNSLASVRKAAEAFVAQSPKLNILILNAGVMAAPFGLTADGHETQFGTNHLAHFLLLQLLLPALERSATTTSSSRVVILSSSAHRTSGINFSEFIPSPEHYNPWVAYGQSKTANIYTASELERRFGTRGVHGYAVHPGITSSTGLTQHVDEATKESWKDTPDVHRAVKSSAQGAATTVWAATALALEGSAGKYLEDCQIAKPAAGEDLPMWEPGYAPHAYDAEKERKLWDVSLELVKPFLA